MKLRHCKTVQNLILAQPELMSFQIQNSAPWKLSIVLFVSWDFSWWKNYRTNWRWNVPSLKLWFMEVVPKKNRITAEVGDLMNSLSWNCSSSNIWQHIPLCWPQSANTACLSRSQCRFWHYYYYYYYWSSFANFNSKIWCLVNNTLLYSFGGCHQQGQNMRPNKFLEPIFPWLSTPS